MTHPGDVGYRIVCSECGGEMKVQRDTTGQPTFTCKSCGRVLCWEPWPETQRDLDRMRRGV